MSPYLLWPCLHFTNTVYILLHGELIMYITCFVLQAISTVFIVGLWDDFIRCFVCVCVCHEYYEYIVYISNHHLMVSLSSDDLFSQPYSTYPIQSECTTRSISSERRRSGPAGSADTCPPPATRSNWPGCWTGRKPRPTCTLPGEDTTKQSYSCWMCRYLTLNQHTGSVRGSTAGRSRWLIGNFFSCVRDEDEK